MKNIEWIFEKMFDQLTSDGSDLLEVPFDEVSKKTFYSEYLYQTICHLTNQPLNCIKEHLTNKKFMTSFLFKKLKHKISVQILFNDLSSITDLFEKGYQIVYQDYQLAIINGCLFILQYLINHSKIPLDNKLLYYAVHNRQEDIYFFLREKNIQPNISIYQCAVVNSSIAVVKDISQNIGLSTKILSDAFEANQSDIMMFLLKTAQEENLKINQNLITYPILNNNLLLIQELEQILDIDWHPELYYPALLSGSFEMISYLESKIPNIHESRVLDTSKTKKGKKSLLIDDISYKHNNKTYFAHTMNYAIQSKSVEIVDYVYQKGYQITVSNFITAIKQGNEEILQWLVNHYTKSLPQYLFYYLGINSFVSNKMAKAKILIDSKLLNIVYDKKMSVEMYQKENIHLEMIGKSKNVLVDDDIDPDFLMKYHIFFPPIKGSKINYKLLSKVRICLYHNLDEQLLDLINQKMSDVDKQYLIDTLFLFGKNNQVKLFFNQIVDAPPPSTQIIMEVMCYRQIIKMCFLIKNSVLNLSVIKQLHSLAVILNDNLMLRILERYQIEKSRLSTILSSDLVAIHQLLDTTPDLYREEIQNLLKLDDLSIVQKMIIPFKLKKELIRWSKEEDLLEISQYLEKN